MGAAAVLGVAGEGPVADDMAWLDVMAWVVTPRLFAVSAPAAIAVLLSTAVIDWAGASFA